MSSQTETTDRSPAPAPQAHRPSGADPYWRVGARPGPVLVAVGFLAAQRQVHLAAMRDLLELQTSTDDVAARIVIDHTVEHLDADLRWLENAAVRVDASTSDRKLRA